MSTELTKMMEALELLQKGITVNVKPNANLHLLMAQIKMIKPLVEKVENVQDYYCDKDGAELVTIDEDHSQIMKQCPQCSQEVPVKKPPEKCDTEPTVCRHDNYPLNLISDGLKQCPQCKREYRYK